MMIRSRRPSLHYSSRYRLEYLFVVSAIALSCLHNNAFVTVVDAAPYVPCPCTLDIPEDWETECRMYGQPGRHASSLVRWDRVSTKCLDVLFNVTLEPNTTEAADASDAVNTTTTSGSDDYTFPQRRMIPFETLWGMCPFRNYTGAIMEDFIRYVRYSGTDIANEIIGIVAYDSGFFEQDSETEQWALLDYFEANDRAPFNCTLAPNLCWGEVKVYFSRRPGRIGEVCQTLWRRLVPVLAEEQNRARKILCEKETTATSPLSAVSSTSNLVEDECWNVIEQIRQLLPTLSTASCDDIGSGPLSLAPPGPTSCGENSPLATSSASRTGFTTTAGFYAYYFAPLSALPTIITTIITIASVLW